MEHGLRFYVPRGSLPPVGLGTLVSWCPLHRPSTDPVVVHYRARVQIELEESSARTAPGLSGRTRIRVREGDHNGEFGTSPVGVDSSVRPLCAETIDCFSVAILKFCFS